MNRIAISTCFILLLSSSAIASSFSNGIIAGLVTNNINRRIAKSHKIHSVNTEKCKALNPNPFAPENLRDNTKCYPEDEPYKPSFIITFIVIYIHVLIVKKLIFGTPEDKKYILGIVIGNIIDSIIDRDDN
jgi:hypothetical protein